MLQTGNIGLFHLLSGIFQGQFVFLHLQRRNFEHHIHHDSLYDGTQATCSQLIFDSLVYDELIHFRLEGKFHTVHLEQLNILLDDGVLWLCQDITQGIAIQWIQISQDGQASDDFRN